MSILAVLVASSLLASGSATASVRPAGIDVGGGALGARTTGAEIASGSRLFLEKDGAGHRDSVHLYAGFANDPVNLRDPTGMVATCWPWESQEDCSAKVISELKSNSDANDEYFRTHGRSRLRDTAKNYTIGLATMTAAPFVAASTVESFVASPLAFTAGVVGGELANQGAVALGVESPLLRFAFSMIGGMGGSAIARGIRASVLNTSAGALSTVDDLGRVSVAGPQAAGDAGGLRFSQTTASSAFSAEGTFAGETIGSLAGKLRSAAISPADVPVRYVTIRGNNLIVNTRSSLALTRAGIPRSSWRLIDATATDAAAIEARLLRNSLTAEGTDVLRITGAGPGASSLR